MNRQDNKTQYGLFTAISMIVGVVIGSGIFFKSDEILTATGGSITLGVAAFCIGAFSIIFGGLSIAELAIKSKSNTGAIGYYEDFVSKRFASGFGWFQLFVYYPTLNVMESYVGGKYLCSLLNLPDDVTWHIGTGFSVMLLIFAANVLSIKFGSYFQNASTVIKLIPIVIIAVVGIFFTPVHSEIPNTVEFVEKNNVGMGWISSLVPVTFAFAGWIVATDISSQVKKPHRTMPLALTIAPIIVLSAYILYFVGLGNMLGVEYIMSMKNAAVYRAGAILFGAWGRKLLLMFLTISVFGVVNGIVIGMLRAPHVLQSKQMLPSKNDGEFKLSLKTCVIPVVLCTFWMIIQYITTKLDLFENGLGDPTSVSVVLGYAFYIILYMRVMAFKSIKSYIRRFVFPICAIFGAFIILIAGAYSNPLYMTIFSTVYIAVFSAGILYCKKA